MALKKDKKKKKKKEVLLRKSIRGKGGEKS